MKYSSYLFIALGLSISINAHSQSAFSLTDINKMVLDPAFTGMDTAYKNKASLYSETTNYQEGSNLANSNTIGTYQMRLDKIHSGIGLMVNYNYWNASNTEVFNQLAAKLYYRYTLFSGFSIGADAGFVNQNSNLALSEAQFEGGTVTIVPFPTVTINNLDFDGGIGALYHLKHFYAGVTADHLTTPKSSFPTFDYSTRTVDGYINVQMSHYKGVAHNWIVGGNIPISRCHIDLTASYYQLYTLNLNATFETPRFFLGVSALQNNNYENHVFDKGDYYYYAAIAGIKAYKDKVKISFAYNFFPNSGPQPYSLAILEGGLSYSF